MPIPASIENAPVLWAGLGLYYLGFIELSSSRQTGWDIGPIPWLAIEQYSRLKGLDQEQTEAMHYHVGEMDKAFVKHHRKKK